MKKVVWYFLGIAFCFATLSLGGWLEFESESKMQGNYLGVASTTNYDDVDYGFLWLTRDVWVYSSSGITFRDGDNISYIGSVPNYGKKTCPASYSHSYTTSWEANGSLSVAIVKDYLELQIGGAIGQSFTDTVTCGPVDCNPGEEVYFTLDDRKQEAYVWGKRQTQSLLDGWKEGPDWTYVCDSALRKSPRMSYEIYSIDYYWPQPE